MLQAWPITVPVPSRLSRHDPSGREGRGTPQRLIRLSFLTVPSPELSSGYLRCIIASLSGFSARINWGRASPGNFLPIVFVMFYIYSAFILRTSPSVACRGRAFCVRPLDPLVNRGYPVWPFLLQKDLVGPNGAPEDRGVGSCRGMKSSNPFIPTTARCVAEPFYGHLPRRAGSPSARPDSVDETPGVSPDRLPKSCRTALPSSPSVPDSRAT